MSDEKQLEQDMLTFQSSRFGEIAVTAESVIEFPVGLVGFGRAQRFVLLEYKAPFSWLHSVEDPNLAFVVVDGFEFGKKHSLKAPMGDRTCDLQETDEYAILIIVTVRGDPRLTTANLKAPLFINLRNRKGVQVIYDDQRLSTRAPMWEEEGEQTSGAEEKK